MEAKFSIHQISKHIFYCLLAVVTHLTWMSLLLIIVYYVTRKDWLGDAGTIALMYFIGYGGILSYYAAHKWVRK